MSRGGWIGISKKFYTNSKSNVNNYWKSQQFEPELLAAGSFDADSQEFPSCIIIEQAKEMLSRF
jgi:hypothetical protein